MELCICTRCNLEHPVNERCQDPVAIVVVAVEPVMFPKQTPVERQLRRLRFWARLQFVCALGIVLMDVAWLFAGHWLGLVFSAIWGSITVTKYKRMRAYERELVQHLDVAYPPQAIARKR